MCWTDLRTAFHSRSTNYGCAFAGGNNGPCERWPLSFDRLLDIIIDSGCRARVPAAGTLSGAVMLGAVNQSTYSSEAGPANRLMDTVKQMVDHQDGMIRA